MARNPLYTLTLVGTLGMGLGATTAIFTVADALLLRPLPYREPETLVGVGLRLDEETTVPFLFEDQVEPWTEGATFLRASARHQNVSLVRTDGAEPENVAALAVSHDLDDLLGAPLHLGRGFAADDARAGRTAVLTHGYWARNGADPTVLGRTLRLDGEAYTVVGVLGPRFKYPVPGSTQLWIPIAEDGTAAGRALGRAEVVGRLRPGVDLGTARERADALAERLAGATPHPYGWRVSLTPVGQWRANHDLEAAVWMVAAAAGLMLLIALVNGTSLLLARGTTRIDEMRTRRAVGASRRRLLRQMLTESLVVALAAGLTATLLAWGGLSVAREALPDELRFSSVYDFAVEGRTLVFAFALTFAVGLVVGALPAVHTARRSHGGGGPVRADDRSGGRLRRLLVATEVALSVALLAGAGLFVGSFLELTRVDPGFDPEDLLVMELDLSESRYPSGPERAAFFRALEERLQGLPMITGAALADGVPPQTGFSFGVRLEAEGSPPPGEQPFWVPHASAGPDYLEVLGIELLAGRPLGPGDAEARNVIVDRALADHLWDEPNPLGRRFRVGEEGRWMTVVGIVEDLKLMGPDDRRGRFDYVEARADSTARPFMSLALRVRGDPAEAAAAARRVAHALDPAQPIRDLRPATAHLAESIEQPRFLATLMGALAAIALLLAAVGVYGVVAYSVGRRRREMGIRLALGAPPDRVVGRIVIGGMAWVGLGTLAGLALTVLLDDLATSLLFGIRPGDPGTLVGVAVFTLVVAATACWLPAFRAARVDPVEALRTE